MVNYITRRMIQTLIVIVILSYVCFYLMTLMPGDPVEILISSNPKITSADVARLRELYGLDQPAYKRYLTWVGNIAQGDLGYSRTYKIEVTDIIGPRLMNTFYLSALSLLVSLLIAVPLGVYTALKPGSKVDYVLNFFSFAGISVPSFWLAIVLILLFAVINPIFPASGTQSIGLENPDMWTLIKDRMYYLALPVMSLSIQQIGRFVRFVRSSMLETLHNDYIRTARAKGLDHHLVVWRHAFRNALIPLITVLALSISTIFSGAVLTETLFSYQGVGKLVYDAISQNDYNVAMVSFIISVSMVLIMNLVADILYGFADPRISYS